MKTVSVAELHNSIDALLHDGQVEPVEIVRDGERLGIFVSDADAELIEDMLLAQKTALARKGGMIGADASAALLARLRNAAD